MAGKLRYSPTYYWFLGEKRVFLAAPKPALPAPSLEKPLKLSAKGIITGPAVMRVRAMEIAAELARQPGCRSEVRASENNNYFKLLPGGLDVAYLRPVLRAPVKTRRMVAAMRRRQRLLTPDELLVAAMTAASLRAEYVELVSSRVGDALKADWDSSTSLWRIRVTPEHFQSLAWEYYGDESLSVYPLREGYFVLRYAQIGRPILVETRVLEEWCKDERHLV